MTRACCALREAALAGKALAHGRQLAVQLRGTGLALAQVAVQRSQLALQAVQLVLHLPLQHSTQVCCLC